MSYIEPGLICILLILIASAVLRSGRGMKCGALLLFLWCWPPIAWLTAALLEFRYEPRQLPSASVDTIVVLSGNQLPPNKARPEALPGRHTFERIAYTAWAWKQTGAGKWVVATGGRSAQGPAYAEVMRDTLVAYGVDPVRILLETKAQSTAQNALFTAQLLQSKGTRRIALVTTARHMPRAAAAFRKQGFEVQPCAAGFATYGFRWGWLALIPSTEALVANEETLHELIGLTLYWLKGLA